VFDPVRFIDEEVEKLKRDIDGTAIIAASGGVDSTVAAVLASRAIDDGLFAVHVDTGFMRKGESATVRSLLERMNINHVVVDASQRYFDGLKGIIDPEDKRKQIGEIFIRIFEEEAKKIGARYLVQGTIAPDWIESGGGLRDTIKSHHNVGGLPEKMELQLIEPLRDLYKDEVRKVARELEISISERQPFPGPGLAIRILGEATSKRADLVREACAIIEDEFEKAAQEEDMEIPWQYFGVLVPVRSVGVQGDVRAYGNTVVIRAVQSLDGMTAAYSKIPHEVLERVSTRITNELKDDITRVVFDITNKPPGTIEWE